MNKYNLNRIERHYMIEVMLTFENKHGREMTDAEFAAAVEKNAGSQSSLIQGVKQMAEIYIILFGIVGIALLCSIGLFIGTVIFLK